MSIRCNSSGLPIFSQSQSSSESLPGATGISSDSLSDLNYIVVGSLTYSAIPSLVYSLNSVVSPIENERGDNTLIWNFYPLI